MTPFSANESARISIITWVIILITYIMSRVSHSEPGLPMSKLKQNCIFFQIQDMMLYTFRMVRQALLFYLKWRLLRKIDYTGNFTNLWSDSSPALESMITVGRLVVSVLRSSLPAVSSISVIQSIEPTSRHVKKRNLHPWASFRVSCVYFVFFKYRIWCLHFER